MAVGSVPSTGTNQTLNLQDFLKILLTQLQYQDPLKPMDNQEFMAQMAQFSTLQQTQQLNDNITQLLAVQSATQSIGMIGRTVSVGTADGTVTGQVVSMDLTNGAPSLSVKLTSGQTLTGIGLSQILSVK